MLDWCARRGERRRRVKKISIVAAAAAELKKCGPSAFHGQAENNSAAARIERQYSRHVGGDYWRREHRHQRRRHVGDLPAMTASSSIDALLCVRETPDACDKCGDTAYDEQKPGRR